MTAARTTLAGGILVTSFVVAMAAPVWDSKDGVVFPPGKAASLMQTCTRHAPAGVAGWMPSKDQVAELEIRLPVLLEQEGTRSEKTYIKATGYGKIPWVMPHYLRQYGGIVWEGKKQIYVNGFAASAMHDDHWRVRDVTVCDGVTAFFWVLYDPGSRQFPHLAFNGPF